MFSFLKRRNGRSKIQGLPSTPLSAEYSKEFHRLIRIYRPQLVERRNLKHDATMLDIFDDGQVIAMHQNAWKWALHRLGENFRGRNAHRNRSALIDELQKDTYEWVQLAYAAQVMGRSQMRLWNKMCQSLDNETRTPLRRLASTVKSEAIDYPPFKCLVGEGGELLGS